MRTGILIDLLTKQCRQILVNLYLPTEMKIMMRRRDYFNRNALHYMEKINAFDLLATKVMDRIMKDYWRSSIDTGGSFFQVSTGYQLLKTSNLHLWPRIWQKRDPTGERSHFFTFQVYLKSMQLRCFLELGVFVLFAVLFQKFVGDFDQSLYRLREEIDHLIELKSSGHHKEEIY